MLLQFGFGCVIGATLKSAVFATAWKLILTRRVVIAMYACRSTARLRKAELATIMVAKLNQSALS